MAKKQKNVNNSGQRIPVVTILGHVDHGKTTLLDKIRGSDVQSGEHGGITQKIAVYTVQTKDSMEITFIDTPGHEAFDLMRIRGGGVANIVLLIVAGNDGVKPQTVESIKIINESKSKPIVVITKIDLPDVDTEAIKRDLANNGLVVESMGGDAPVVEVSAKTGEGIDELLSAILLLNEMEGPERGDLPDNVKAKLTVLETVKDKSRGFVSSVIVSAGEVSVGDWVVYLKDGDVVVERIKGFLSEDGETLKQLRAGFGGRIIGLSNPWALGSDVYVVTSNKKRLVREVGALLKQETETDEFAREDDSSNDMSNISDEDLLASMFEEEEPDSELNIVLKAPSQGSLEALVNAVDGLEVEGVKVRIQSSGVGDVTMGDVETASLTKALLIAFDVKQETGVERMAKSKKVLIKDYHVIYKVVDEILEVLAMMATPDEIEEELGSATILQIFTLSDGKQVLGGRVDSGIVKKGAKVYVVRGDEILTEATIVSLKHAKNEIKEAGKDMTFGAILSTPAVDAAEGDLIHCFVVKK